MCHLLIIQYCFSMKCSYFLRITLSTDFITNSCISLTTSDPKFIVIILAVSINNLKEKNIGHCAMPPLNSLVLNWEATKKWCRDKRFFR